MLKKKRNELGITQQELADELFVTRQTVSRWENNLSYPNLDTLVEISNILDLSLDEFLKGEGADVVNKISNDVREKGKYQKYSITVSSVIAGIICFLIILGVGRYTQNHLIDRMNPFLTTHYGYGILPAKNQEEADTFISDDPFGNGEWLRIKSGQYPSQARWVIVAHRGSNVLSVRNLTRNELPAPFREQVGKEYYGYNKKDMGPRVSKKWNWSPFLGSIGG